MRWWLLAALQVAPMLALPLAHHSDWNGRNSDLKIEVLDFDFKSGSASFAVGPGLSTELTSPLVFDLQVQPVQDPRTSNISLSGQPLNITWNQLPDPQPYYHVRYPITGRIKQTVPLQDKTGVSHSVDLEISGWGDVHPKSPAASTPEDAEQFIHISVQAIDGYPVEWTVALHSRPVSPGRALLKLMEGFENSSQRDHLHREQSFLNASPLEQLTYLRHIEDDEFNIEEEIESLLLLEAEAGPLDVEIAARKKAIAKCLKNHRDRATLRHLLQECDGIVCAAKVIAQRVCDKVGILTEPNFHYAQVQDPRAQQLIQIDDEKPLKIAGLEGEFQSLSEKPTNKTLSGNRYFALHTNSAAVTESITVVYPQSVLFRVLALIATAIGLTALCAFIRRKCMSARKQVDRLAEREERRNERAYRRAARRAEMRRRWNSLIAAVSCFRAQPEPRIEDYEEKRALILQDAFMEQDIEAAEKGEVMEAEIRELRNANQIVASLVHAGPSNRPSLPAVVVARSRASTGTLPSYTSEMLPDYRSRYTRTEHGSTATSSVRSDSLVAVSLDRYTLTSSSEEAFTGSTRRSNSPESSSGLSRFTITSSIVDYSPRPSAETLRTVTVGRKSRDFSGL